MKNIAFEHMLSPILSPLCNTNQRKWIRGDPRGNVLFPFLYMVSFPTDYHVVAEGLGGKGFLLSCQNEEQMDDIIRTAQSECKRGRPILLNALIGTTSFREGSISV